MSITSGTYDFAPGMEVLAAESWERAGMDPQVMSGEHVSSIRRSIGFILSTWSGMGARQWKFQQTQETTTVGMSQFTLPAGTIDVQTVVLRRNDSDTEMYPISREDYLLIPNKTTNGRPDRYFLDRRRDTEDVNLPSVPGTRVMMNIWPRGENATDIIVIDSYLQIEDGGAFANQIDIPFRFQDAFAAELATRIAQKFNKPVFPELKALATEAWTLARANDEGSGDLILTVQYGRHGRR